MGAFHVQYDCNGYEYSECSKNGTKSTINVLRHHRHHGL